MAAHGTVLALDSVTLADAQAEMLAGPQILARLLDAAAEYVGHLRRRVEAGELSPRVALFGRIRGTGPGVSFTRLFERLRGEIPVPLVSPFEQCDSVGGAVMEARDLVSPQRDDALLVLRFDAGSRDLPMHAHEDSERFIYVVSGRGFFHVAKEAVADFTGQEIRHVPVKASDVVLFSRGTVHTFSTDTEPLVLLSYHGPYVPLDDPRQYVVPALRVCPGLTADPRESRIACDVAWLCVA